MGNIFDPASPSNDVITPMLFLLFLFSMISMNLYHISGYLDSLIKNGAISMKKQIEFLNENVLTFYASTYSKINYVTSIEEILVITLKLKNYLSTLIYYRFWIKLFFGDKFISNTINELIILESRWTYLILLDLREDLSKKIEEQSQKLEKAKANLGTNLGNTPELQGITALQSERLDKQIEAFEKLQKKVLV